MRLRRLKADATIVFDGDVDAASKPIARATGLLPGRADPPASAASIFAAQHLGLGPAPQTVPSIIR